MHIKTLGDKKTPTTNKKKPEYKMGDLSLGRRIRGKDFGDIVYSSIINVNQ